MSSYFILLFVVFIVSNNLHYNSKVYNSEKNSVKITQVVQKTEDFSTFYKSFYKDTIFQKERIIKPLKGYLKFWDEDTIVEENWNSKKITITPKETFQHIYKNLKTTLIKNDTIVIEKYWIEQSGFIIEKRYILISGKWFLDRYNISNL